MGSALVGLLTRIISLIGGGVAGAIASVTSLLRGGANQIMQFHEEGIAYARQMGMSLEQARAYTGALTRDTKELARAYGITSKQIIEIQRNLSEATARQLILNRDEMESFVQINKLAGAGAGKKFTEEILNMGGQVETAQNAVNKAYASAMRSGLNASKMTDKIASSLGMVNRLSFKNGVDGLTKMAMKAEKVGMSLQSVEQVAAKFRDFDSAISSSAQLQMLGGAAGAFGGNPLDMMYESNYDPEVLQERMTKMLGGYAKFDEKTGMSKINGVGMDFVRNIAKAMGIDEAEAASIAKKNAELQYKENAFGSRLGKYTDEQRDMLMNKSYVKNGKIYINDANQQAHEITNGQIDQTILDELTKYNNMTDKDIMLEQSQKLTSINESISGFWDSMIATISEKFNDVVPHIQKFIGDIGPKLVPLAEKVASGVEEVITRALTPENIQMVIDGVGKFIDVLGSVLNVVKEVWKWLPEWGKDAILAIGAISMLPGGSSLLKGVGKVGGAANVATGMAGKVLGGAVGVGLGAYQAITADNAADRGAGVGTAVGAVIGTALGGPIGAAIGGFLGDFAGRFIGEHWGDITDAVSGAWDSITGWFKGAWDGWLGTVAEIFFPAYGIFKHWDEICDFVGKSWDSVVNWFRDAWDGWLGTVAEIFFPIYGLIQHWDKICTFVGDAWNSVTGWFSDVWTKASNFVSSIFSNIKAGWDVLVNAFMTPINMFKDAVSGFMNFVKDPIGSLKTGANSLISSLRGKLPGYEDGKSGVDNKLALINDRESVVPERTQVHFLDAVENIQNAIPITSLVAKPVGEKERIYIPSNAINNNGTGGEIKVKDFNINISGSIRLDGGNNSQAIDVRSLLNDVSFVAALKDVIKESIASDINGGRFMNDVSYMRGMPSQSTTLGRMSS